MAVRPTGESRALSEDAPPTGRAQAIPAPIFDEQARRDALKRRLLEATKGEPFLRLAARCPLCAAPPKLRTTEDAKRNLWSQVDPSQFAHSYECHRRECSGVYPVHALDYLLAA
jgi:hypothetical protein